MGRGLSFIFLFIVDRIKVENKLCFNILSKGKKVKNFRFGTFVSKIDINFQFLILNEN